MRNAKFDKTLIKFYMSNVWCSFKFFWCFGFAILNTRKIIGLLCFHCFIANITYYLHCVVTRIELSKCVHPFESSGFLRRKVVDAKTQDRFEIGNTGSC
jgi:hypothetical protein